MKIASVGDGAGKQAAGMPTGNISPLGILAIAINSCTLIQKISVLRLIYRGCTLYKQHYVTMEVRSDTNVHLKAVVKS